MTEKNSFEEELLDYLTSTYPEHVNIDKIQMLKDEYCLDKQRVKDVILDNLGGSCTCNQMNCAACDENKAIISIMKELELEK